MQRRTFLGAIAGLGLSAAGAAATRHDEVNSVVPWNIENLGFEDPTPEVEEFGWGSSGFEKAQWRLNGHLKVWVGHRHHMELIGVRTAGGDVGSEYATKRAPRYNGTVQFDMNTLMQRHEKYDVWDFEIVGIRIEDADPIGKKKVEVASVYAHMPEDHRRPRFED